MFIMPKKPCISIAQSASYLTITSTIKESKHLFILNWKYINIHTLIIFRIYEWDNVMYLIVFYFEINLPCSYILTDFLSIISDLLNLTLVIGVIVNVLGVDYRLHTGLSKSTGVFCDYEVFLSWKEGTVLSINILANL